MAEKALNHSDVEKKWQDRWFSQGLNRAEAEKGKDKFFLIFAYPGISGFLHVGHMRGFTYSDVITRYKRMRGYNVLFPAGFHASGIPAISLAKRVARGEEKMINYLRRNGCAEEDIEKMSDPMFVVDYFSRVYTEDYWKRFGFLIDYRRAMTTISPGYNRFIQWQFRKLHEKGLLTQKPHYAPYCPNCGPVAVDASETDVSKGGSAEVLEFTVLKFKLPDGRILPAATLRPETVFGVTNMWLNPDAHYVEVDFKGETWIMSIEAAEKLKHQQPEGDVDIKGDVNAREIIGQYCTVPLVERDVIILPSRFVDPKIATGVVMSVPAHAPYDWIALEDLRSNDKYIKWLGEFGIDVEVVRAIEPITLIANSPRGDDPAGSIIKEMGITSQEDQDKLEEATKIIYSEEFHSGILNDNCREYAGQKVSEVKDDVIDDLKRSVGSISFMEFSEEVVCRCGANVIIKLVPDQWFIRYSDPELTEKSIEHSRKMTILPEDYYNSIPRVLEWFSDRACIRKGSWLGTEFPFKKGWIIEPISDSTLYPAYYIISKYVNEGRLKPEEMDDAFFDYVFGLSDERPPVEVADEVRDEFFYFYPLDINLGGKEHMTVHFPVFLMNHVGIMPERFWPRGIFVHWWVIQSGGEKISKSKGGAEPIPNAAEEFGVDPMRLYYCHIGSPSMDVEWDRKAVEDYRNRLERIVFSLTEEIEKLSKYGDHEGAAEKWLRSSVAQVVERYTAAMDKFDLRAAATEAYFTMPGIMKWYRRRADKPSRKAVRMYIETAVKLMAPITPHWAEELWERLGGEGFVSVAPIEPMEYDTATLVLEDALQALMDDIKEIAKVTGMQPKKATLYTAARWKYRALAEMLSMDKPNPGAVIKTLMSDPELRKFGKAVPKYVQGAVKDINKMTPEYREVLKAMDPGSERDFLAGAMDFLKKELGFDIEVIAEEDAGGAAKAGAARPLKPAVLLE